MTEVRITDPKTGGQKGRKPERYDLIPWDAMDEVARVYGVGADKYEDDNWLRGYSWRLSLGALLRHVAQWAIGNDYDTGEKGTGCHHLACAAWHCLALLTFHKRGLGTDDRGKAKRDETPKVSQRPPVVGDLVRVTSKDHFEGRIGTVLFSEADGSACHVRFSDTESFWFELKELAPA